MTPREIIEATVAERAIHRTKDEVGDTRSFGNMEQTLKREYWGRFLIELLQNARDAWLASDRASGHGVVRIRLTADPALIVANEGVPITPEIVLDSIGKFGESTKTYGTGIGHKGIGFKSVLEISLTPELYSRAEAEDHDLRVRFDPEVAESQVRAVTPDWDDLVAQLESAGSDDATSGRMPTLRYPLWIDEVDAGVRDAAAFDGRVFDTVVRLPYDPRFDHRLLIDQQDFVGKCRDAIAELSDEIVLFLGVFETIVIEDELAPENDVLVRRDAGAVRQVEGGGQVTPICISRNGVTTSEWWLYERKLEAFPDLEGDLSLAFRMEDQAGAATPIVPSAGDERSSADAFHLFFPTRIKTHLPFVPHAYFEVDASRKGFAADSEVRNRALLEGLQSLAIDAFRDLGRGADAGLVDLSTLPDVLAATEGEPEDELAREFRSSLLSALDDEPWVASGSLGSLPGRVSPREILAEPRGDLATTLPQAFPATYLHTRTGLRYPHERVSEAGLGFLAKRAAIARSGAAAGLDPETARVLLTPGSVPIWFSGEDDGFRSLLRSLEELVQYDRDVEALLAEIRDDPEARIVPVVAGDDSGRTMRALRPHGRYVAEADDVARIMARIRSEAGTSLAPPPSLGIDFVADGVLDAELLGSIAARIGIRPYTTVAVLDALAARERGGGQAEELRFVWRLLLRESESGYSVAAALRESGSIAPETWFWARPGDAGSEAEADRRRRERALGSVGLPTLAGGWRAAKELAFGNAWADWLEQGAGTVVGDWQRRVAAYRDLEELAPSPADLIAPPETILELLTLDEGDVSWWSGENTPGLPESSEDRHAKLAFAFLLRLGVWEVAPVEGLIERRDRPEEERDPWADLPDREAHMAEIRGLESGFAKYPHRNVHVGEDYRLAWPVVSSAAMTRCLGRAWRLLEALGRIVLFCPRCRHTTRYWSDDAPGYGSYLKRQLTTTPWVPVTVEGISVTPVTPDRAWDSFERPDVGRMAQSWMRFLPLVEPGFDQDLATFLGIGRIETADVERVKRLLLDLRERFELGEIDAARRASSFPSLSFQALHWRLYERLSRVDAEAAAAIVTDLGVLATKGTTLGFYPPDDVRHDDGSAGPYKRHFIDQVPLSVLRQEMGSTADALGIPRLRISVTREGDEAGTDVTDRVRPFVHDRAAELLALQVFRPVFGTTLELGSRAFRERAARLDALRVVQLQNLVLRVAVPELDIEILVGEERDQDVHLEGGTTAHPVLYHDLTGQWEERLRTLAAGHLASLMETPGYAALFQLLLEQPTDERRIAFLDEHGVSEADLERVTASIEYGGTVARQADERWWRALLPLLGAEPLPEPLAADDHNLLLERLRALEPTRGTELVTRLLSPTGTEAMRRDVEPDGLLALLEDAGVELAEFDRRLRDLGDDGLSVNVASRLLSEWRRAHGRSLTAVLLALGRDEDPAAQAPRNLVVADHLRFRVRPSAAEWLAPVVDLLASEEVIASPERLASTQAADYMASLVDMTPAELETIWTQHYSAEERARLLQETAAAWRRSAIPVVVAARTRAGLPAYRLRAEAAVIDRELPPSPPDPRSVGIAIADALPKAPGLVEALIDLIQGWPPLTLPDAHDINAVASEHLTYPGHLDAVIRALKRGTRNRSDKVRKEIQAVKAAGVRPTPFAGAKPPAAKAERPPHRKPRPVGPRQRRDQRVLDRLGLDAERWVRASILGELLALETAEYEQAVTEMRDLVLEVATGDLIDKLVVAANEALAQDVDEDDRLDALATLVHVADISDGFGFDLLGWVAPYPGAARRAMMLEVKSVGPDRSFIVSSFEWERAEEERDRYAFLIALRSSTGPPSAMELIPDPEDLRQEGLLPRDPDGWRVRYQPETPTS